MPQNVLNHIVLIVGLLALVAQSLGAQSARLDADGNELPHRAIMRLGSRSLRVTESIQHFDISPDGKTVVTVEQARGEFPPAPVTRVWDAVNGKERYRLELGGEVAVSPEGMWLATTRGLHKLEDGELIAEFKLSDPTRPDVNQSPSRLVFSADGTTVAALAGQTVYAWDGNPFRQRSVLPFTQRPDGLALSHDGQQVAVTLHGPDWNNYDVQVWNLNTGEQARPLAYGGLGNRLAFSPDSEILAMGNGMAGHSSERSIQLWDVASGDYLYSLRGLGSSLRDLRFSPGGRSLAAVYDYHGLVWLWDYERARRLHLLPAAASHAAFTGDGQLLITAGGASVRFWKTSSGEEEERFIGHHHPVAALAFKADGRMLASCAADGTVRLWDVATGQQRWKFMGRGDAFSSLAFSPDGRRLAVGANQTTSWHGILLLDAATGKHEKDIPLTRASQLAFTDQGVVTLDRHSLQVWDAATVAQKVRLQIEQQLANTMGASRDGHLVAAAVGTGVRLWEPVAEKSRDLAFDRPVTAMALSPDGAVLAVGAGQTEGLPQGTDVSLRLIDAKEGTELRRLGTYTRTITALAFSTNNRWLAVVDKSGRLSVWDAADGSLRFEIENPDGPALAVALSRDGRLAAAFDTSILLWDVPALQAR